LYLHYLSAVMYGSRVRPPDANNSVSSMRGW